MVQPHQLQVDGAVEPGTAVLGNGLASWVLRTIVLQS